MSEKPDEILKKKIDYFYVCEVPTCLNSVNKTINGKNFCAIHNPSDPSLQPGYERKFTPEEIKMYNMWDRDRLRINSITYRFR